jgi:hypothetical protein
MPKLFALALLLLADGALAAADSARFIAQVKLPSGQTVVVAEGDFEARSLGSFSLRLYEAAGPEDATTFFSAGVVCARDGSIERVVVADVTGDSQPEVVVIVRSVGTGGYLSAQAFTIAAQQLSLQSKVVDLPADADPVAALRASNKAIK